jgi:putative cell wall-binding protein
MLLTEQGSLPANTQQALTNLGIKQVIIPGGTAAVATGVESSIAALNGGITVIRFAGSGRTDTAARVASFETATPAAAAGSTPAVNGLGFARSHANLARGDDFADALAGGPHAGRENGVVLLTENPTTLGTFTTAYLRLNSAVASTGGISNLDIFGGTSAVSSGVEQDARNALAGG